MHRPAQAQVFRDAGRHDLADQAEARNFLDAAKGAVNGVARGTTVAVTQAVLGANPLTAGIGLVALDVVETYNRRCLSLSFSQNGAARYGPQKVVCRLMAASPIRTA